MLMLFKYNRQAKIRRGQLPRVLNQSRKALPIRQVRHRAQREAIRFERDRNGNRRLGVLFIQSLSK